MGRQTARFNSSSWVWTVHPTVPSRVRIPHVSLGEKLASKKPKKLSKHEVRNMNELLKIAELLENKYGDNSHFLITKAEKTENGWNITIQPAKENGGAANESNE